MALAEERHPTQACIQWLMQGHTGPARSLQLRTAEGQPVVRTSPKVACVIAIEAESPLSLSSSQFCFFFFLSIVIDTKSTNCTWIFISVSFLGISIKSIYFLISWVCQMLYSSDAMEMLIHMAHYFLWESQFSPLPFSSHIASCTHSYFSTWVGEIEHSIRLPGRWTGGEVRGREAIVEKLHTPQSFAQGAPSEKQTQTCKRNFSSKFFFRPFLLIRWSHLELHPYLRKNSVAPSTCIKALGLFSPKAVTWLCRSNSGVIRFHSMSVDRIWSWGIIFKDNLDFFTRAEKY